MWRTVGEQEATLDRGGHVGLCQMMATICSLDAAKSDTISRARSTVLNWCHKCALKLSPLDASWKVHNRFIAPRRRVRYRPSSSAPPGVDLPRPKQLSPYSNISSVSLAQGREACNRSCLRCGWGQGLHFPDMRNGDTYSMPCCNTTLG